MSDGSDANAYPAMVTYVDGVPEHIEIEARSDGSNNPDFATYEFEVSTAQGKNDTVARLTKIDPENGAYGVVRNRGARLEVREAVEALPFVGTVEMFPET